MPLWLGIIVAAAALGCGKPAPQALEVGRHRLRFVLPKGWEHLDHGRQQLFRIGEAQVSVVDMGPVTREAMARELRGAKDLWLAGRRGDAFQRVREIRGPALRFAASQQRADFWKPWTDATYAAAGAESGAIGSAIDALIEGTATLPEVTPEWMLDYVLLLNADMRRREIGSRSIRNIHGADWAVLDLWDPVSHMNRSRVAFLVNDGCLLVMTTDHGLFEVTSAGFDALLNSFEVAPRSATQP